MSCWVCATSLWFDWPKMRKGRRRPVVIVVECPCCEQRYDVSMRLVER